MNCRVPKDMKRICIIVLIIALLVLSAGCVRVKDTAEERPADAPVMQPPAEAVTTNDNNAVPSVASAEASPPQETSLQPSAEAPEETAEAEKPSETQEPTEPETFAEPEKQPEPEAPVKTEKQPEPEAPAEPEAPEESQPTTAAIPENMLLQLASSGLSPEDIAGSQLIIVASSGSDAQLYTYQKNAEGVWESKFEAVSAHVGRNGVSADKVEGDKKTPAGLFRLGHAFGAEEAPETALEYRRITPDSYWVDDSGSKYYNQWVEGTADKDWNSAEHLADYPSQYALAVVIEYNTENTVKGAGSAIFLHCGSGATVGCVSVSHQDMLAILGWLKPDANAMILIH